MRSATQSCHPALRTGIPFRNSVTQKFTKAPTDDVQVHFVLQKDIQDLNVPVQRRIMQRSMFEFV
jgi:hypothetical protein